MKTRYNLKHLHKHFGKGVPAGTLPAVFDEDPTDDCPHEADGLSRADGETLEQWVARYQRVTGKRALVSRPDGSFRAYTEDRGWHDGMELFL